MFTPKIGEDEPILTHIFQMGWFNHQLASQIRWVLWVFFGGSDTGHFLDELSFGTSDDSDEYHP